MAMRARKKIHAPRRGLSSNNPNTFEDDWALLASSMREIHTHNASQLSFEELYRKAYRIVLTGKCAELHQNVIQLEVDWLGQEIQSRITKSIAPILLVNERSDVQEQSNERLAAGQKFLHVLKNTYNEHALCMGMITDVLMYMDRVITTEQRKPPMYSTAMCLYRDCILRSNVRSASTTTILDLLKTTVLFNIHLERVGYEIERQLIGSCMQVLEHLFESSIEEGSATLYAAVFEPAFLETSRQFYRAEGQRILAMADAATFCKIAKDRIKEERDRCVTTISWTTETKIKDVLNEELISKNIAEVVNLEATGVRNMLDNDRTSVLASVYELNARVDVKKTPLIQAVQKRIVEMGQEVNASSASAAQPAKPADKETNGEKKPTEKEKDNHKEKEKEKPVNQQTVSAIKWVDDVLSLKGKFDRIWRESFKEDQGMEGAMMSSFSEFVNANPRSSEYLSLFFDENLKKGIKGKTEIEVDALLDNGITLLRYVKDKDLFETYYKKHLARRLLMKRSVSMDAERQMISKMKIEVGNQFTQRLESMFKDMTISEDLSSSYKDYIKRTGESDSKGVELEINVLTSTMWPMEIMSSTRNGEVQLPCIFPKEVEDVKQSFERFYLSKHSGRKLSWQASMGTADIRATFQRSNGKIQRHDLNVSTYAMAILVLFNEVPTGEALTYEDIQARTRIPDHDLARNLQSLAVAPKTRVLKKDPMSRDVSKTDKFFFNHDFQSPFMKVRIGVVSGGANKVENQDQRKETEKKMNDERGASIEAAVVRIMKQRKNLVHSQLISEVLAQLSSRFSPDVNMVKKRIESLIDREYLERVAEEPPTYGYIA